MTRISVIIPFFNAGQHLKNCIESLLSQTLQSCEFLFINDGSSDESRSIIEEYQKIDSRILLVNQLNKGVSAARNSGLVLAKGDYIGFVDADDTVEPDMFQKLVELAQQNDAEIVISRYVLHQKNKQILSPAIFPENELLDATFIQKEIIPHFLRNENLNAIWNKVYKRELLQNHTILFPVGMALGEDGLFNMAAFSNSQKAYFTDFTGYHYFEIEGSATRDFASKNYYETILKEFHRDDDAFANAFLTKEKITELKAQKFLSKAISLIHEYMNPIHKLDFTTKYKAVSQVVNDSVFTQILNKNYTKIAATKGKYERLILWSAKNKWIPLLFIATAYSRFRNQ